MDRSLIRRRRVLSLCAILMIWFRLPGREEAIAFLKAQEKRARLDLILELRQRAGWLANCFADYLMQVGR